MNELDAETLYAYSVRFCPGSHQIVYAGYADVFHPVKETLCERAPYEATYAGNQDLHSGLLSRRWVQLEASSSKIMGRVLAMRQLG